ncbi:MAG TPA: FAD-dependent oxidoreductase [Nocardioides sp.]|nr:FAD-dependent oxidoreductase [Nocardioides sp.]
MDTRTTPYDVVIVGAGICGLNALFVVSQYLGSSGRVALVDQRERVGGMWNDTYDYVRLHQAHPFFTAGNLKWQWDKDPSYLATKPEVLDHMAYCFDVLRQRTQVAEYLGWSYLAHDEGDGVVRTVVERDGEQVVLESHRLVKALGFDVRPNEPLALSSSTVRSVSPDSCDVRTGDLAASDAPVWVVGGGKTAMDTVHAVLTTSPGREVNLVAGSGTYFMRRDEIYAPSRGWRRGTRFNRFAEDFGMRYDGTNEATIFEAELGRTMTTVTPTASNWVIGIISDEEVDRIRAGLTRTVMDHLVDVVDTESGADLVLRSGERVTVPAGTWVVNCTGYLLKDERPYEPFSSPSGRVLSINQRSDALLFTIQAGFLLTHLLMRDQLHRAPLCEIDWYDLRRSAGSATTPAMWAVLMHNFTVLLGSLPISVFLRSGLDVDRWYPEPRRQLGALAFLLTRRRQQAHYRRTIDTVRERYGVRCGPLDHTGTETARA